MVKVSIDWWIGELRRHGASGVDQYEAKLRSFRGNEQKVFEFIAEARAALLFLRNGIKVVMQDRPDLRLSFKWGDNLRRGQALQRKGDRSERRQGDGSHPF
jgi:hypothetical protein